MRHGVEGKGGKVTLGWPYWGCPIPGSTADARFGKVSLVSTSQCPQFLHSYPPSASLWTKTSGEFRSPAAQSPTPHWIQSHRSIGTAHWARNPRRGLSTGVPVKGRHQVKRNITERRRKYINFRGHWNGTFRSVSCITNHNNHTAEDFCIYSFAQCLFGEPLTPWLSTVARPEKLKWRRCDFHRRIWRLLCDVFS